ncbi:MAG: protein-export chaperone SecB [Candidatus Wenzhouxiangella sp. M2_3B_020]
MYPYARGQIAALIAAGGFFTPPLQPINFEAIYAQRVAEGQQQGEAAGGESPVQ